MFLKRVAIFVRPFFILFCLICPFKSLGQFSFNEKNRKAYYEILQLKIPTDLKSSGKAENALNGINIYLNHLAETVKILVEEDPSTLEKYKLFSEGAEKVAETLNSESPYYAFLLGEIKLQRAFVKLKFGEEVSSMWELRQAYKILEENISKHPDFLPNKKSMGLLKILIGSVPEKYMWIVSLMGMEGGIKEGLTMLQELSASTSPFKEEAEILRTAVINFILGKEENASQSAYELYQHDKKNLLYTFLYASVCMKYAHSEEALAALSNRPENEAYLNFAYLDLMQGDIFLQTGDYTKAYYLYKNFLVSYKGMNFKKEAYYKIFLCYWLNNEDNKAFAILPKILNEGNAIYDGDKYALYFAKNKDFTDKKIMKARLAIDGGYFKTASDILGEIKSKDLPNNKDQIEYYYRLARLNHKTEKLNTAIGFYKKTIEMSGLQSYYFAPNAALQLGYIYRDENNKDLAIYYFQKALSYKDYYYKNSIDNKARGAINDLKKK